MDLSIVFCERLPGRVNLHFPMGFPMVFPWFPMVVPQENNTQMDDLITGDDTVRNQWENGDVMVILW